jgi:hypothetical protein
MLTVETLKQAAIETIKREFLIRVWAKKDLLPAAPQQMHTWKLKFLAQSTKGFQSFYSLMFIYVILVLTVQIFPVVPVIFIKF